MPQHRYKRRHAMETTETKQEKALAGLKGAEDSEGSVCSAGFENI